MGSVDAAVHNYRKVLGDRGKERMGLWTDSMRGREGEKSGETLRL